MPSRTRLSARWAALPTPRPIPRSSCHGIAPCRTGQGGPRQNHPRESAKITCSPTAARPCSRSGKAKGAFRKTLTETGGPYAAREIRTGGKPGCPRGSRAAHCPRALANFHQPPEGAAQRAPPRRAVRREILVRRTRRNSRQRASKSACRGRFPGHDGIAPSRDDRSGAKAAVQEKSRCSSFFPFGRSEAARRPGSARSFIDAIQSGLGENSE